MDETVLGHRKYGKGRLTVDQIATERSKHTVVFGAVEKGPNGRRLLLKKAEGKSRRALLPPIANHILPGTTIVSDELAAYKGLERLPNYNYLHFTVNHKQNYVNPKTGRHTNGIESEWQKLKEDIVKRPYGVRRKHLDSYLSKHMWRVLFKGRDSMHHLWRQIAQLYPCEGCNAEQEPDVEIWVDDDDGSDSDSEGDSGGDATNVGHENENADYVEAEGAIAKDSSEESSSDEEGLFGP
jgi:ISXO2-like transposase domain